MSLQVKTKAIELILSDGVTPVYVHSPKTGDLPAFLRGIPALSAMADLLKGTDKSVSTIPVKDEDLEDIYPLLTSMVEYKDETGAFQPMTLEDFKGLPVWDSIMILEAFTAFVPKNLTPSPVFLEPTSSIAKD